MEQATRRAAQMSNNPAQRREAKIQQYQMEKQLKSRIQVHIHNSGYEMELLTQYLYRPYNLKRSLLTSKSRPTIMIRSEY